MREVLSVNKLSNRVFVKGGEAVSTQAVVRLNMVSNGAKLFSRRRMYRLPTSPTSITRGASFSLATMSCL